MQMHTHIAVCSKFGKISARKKWYLMTKSKSDIWGKISTKRPPKLKIVLLFSKFLEHFGYV